MKINSSYLLATKAEKISGGGGGSFPSWATDYFLFPAADVSAAGYLARIGSIEGETLAAGCENGGWCLFLWALSGQEYGAYYLDGRNYQGVHARLYANSGGGQCYTYASKSDAMVAVLTGEIGHPVYSTQRGNLWFFSNSYPYGSVFRDPIIYDNGLFSSIYYVRDSTGVVTHVVNGALGSNYYSSTKFKKSVLAVLHYDGGYTDYVEVVAKPLR